MKTIKALLYTGMVIAVISFAFRSYYNNLRNDFTSLGAAKKDALESDIKLSSQFIDVMTIYGNEFFNNNDSNKGSNLYNSIQYDPTLDGYHLDTIGGTEGEKDSGNLTGEGNIPQSGIERDEINLALSYNRYFREFYSKIPDIAWIYYTSNEGFLNIYPWVASDDFRYSDDLKEVSFFVNATPEKDPLRKAVWTPVYLDEAGKGLMVTRSSPIYNGDQFMGVISIDFATETLSRILDCEYDGFLVDEEFSVIATNKDLQQDKGVYKLHDLMNVSTKYIQDILQVEQNTLHRVGGYYVYKSSLNESPWTMLLFVPIYLILFQALLNTLPEVIICVLFIQMYREIMNRIKAEERLKNATLTDPLTGLKNRRYLDAIIEKEMERSDRYHLPLSFITLDLDHFKRINDTWGHPVGDEVLKQTASIIQSMIRKADILVRLGGEEFIILLPQIDLTGANEVAEKIRKALENNAHSIVGKYTASFGVVERKPGESYKSLYKRVDDALYLAKSQGRNCVVSSHNPEVSVASFLKLEWNRAWESGNKEIDKQHRELLETGNKLMTLLLSNSDPNEMEQKYDMLFKNIANHFEYEEHTLTELGYTATKEHADIHRDLIRKAMILKEFFRSGKVKPSDFFSFLLDDVIVGHMLEEDAKFYPYTKKHTEKK